MKFRFRNILILILAIGVLSSVKWLVHLLTELWWFESVGFSEVFWIRLTWQLAVWLSIATIAFLFLWSNYRLAMHQTRSQSFRILEQEFAGKPTAILVRQIQRSVNGVAFLLIGGIAFAIATANLPIWETLLKFLHTTEVGKQDPIFQQDIGFYLFQLPFYDSLRAGLLGLLLGGLLLSGLVYSLKEAIAWQSVGRIQMARGAKAHLSGLLAAIALVMSLSFWLDRYHLLYRAGPVVFGIGYTDAQARLWAYGLMSVLAIGVALLFGISVRQRHYFLPLSGIGLSIGLFILANGIYPALLQQLVVNPNELSKEKPYLEHNIQFTQAAYHLDDVQRQNDAAIMALDRQVLQNNQPTVQNIRLWDHRPLLSTYHQLQEIRLYYQFQDVDVDRYRLNGTYQQVMLAGRELAFSQVPAEAQTWVNRHLKYTHGYGLVMSPVNQITQDGLPVLYIKDIPPTKTVDLPIEQAAIYYGEETRDYIVTNATTPEFDYPLGDQNVFTQYKGNGGVPLSSLWRRLAYAYDFSSLQLLISNYLTDQSRLHYYRLIQERVRHIAPFLRFDSDPYLAVIDGRLQWIVDGYTVSDRYPYSPPVATSPDVAAILQDSNVESITQGQVNYIRNSVKVVIDAADGTLQFFTVDETDPVLATYRQIFPQLFQPYAAIPEAVKAHFRYPLDLFKIQVQMYLTYHMSDPDVFYNREDLWRFPLQTYEGNEQVMEPYYAIMRLPGEPQAGFMLILPLTPAQKDNMTAWMAARSNGPDYGKLLRYDFPKQTLIYGPRQIEARIDQDPQISQQFTLWSQAGSKVIRGDLLVIPIEQSLLYVEPVYLRAEQGELPQLKRVIVAYDQKVVMTETLERSLAAIFGGAPAEATAASPLSGAVSTQIRSAWETYQKAQEALRQGDWATYGRYQQALETILQRLNQGNSP